MVSCVVVVLAMYTFYIIYHLLSTYFFHLQGYSYFIICSYVYLYVPYNNCLLQGYYKLETAMDLWSFLPCFDLLQNCKHIVATLKQLIMLSLYGFYIWDIDNIRIWISETSGSELRGQEEAACVHVFRPMRPLQWVIYIEDRSKFLKCCSSTTIMAIA